MCHESSRRTAVRGKQTARVSSDETLTQGRSVVEPQFFPSSGSYEGRNKKKIKLVITFLLERSCRSDGASIDVFGPIRVRYPPCVVSPRSPLEPQVARAERRETPLILGR